MTVLLIILAIITIVLVVPLGVRAAYFADVFSLAARVACFNIRLYPRKPKKDKPEKPKKPKKEKKPKKPKKRRPGDDIEAQKEEKLRKLLQLAKIGLNALGDFRRKLTVNSLTLHVVSAADDPYDAAMLYGGLNSVLPVLLPLAESALNIQKSDIKTGVSFETTEPSVKFEIILTISLARIFGVAFAAGFAYLKFMIRSRRERYRAPSAEERMVEDGTAEPDG